MKLLMHEVLQKVSNAKTKKEKIALLQEYNSQALRSIMIINFDESVVSLLPPGTPPYNSNEVPEGTEHTRLEQQVRLLHHFFKGGSSVKQAKREMMFIQMLEGLHEGEDDWPALEDHQSVCGGSIPHYSVGRSFLMGKGCKIIHRDCDPSMCEDRSLPYTAFMIEYREGGITKYDIASGPKQVDIFDDYYDKYREDFVTMRQTEGRVNPKLWQDPKKKK